MFRRVRLAMEVIIFLSLTGVFMAYLIFPSPKFPKQLPDSVQSLEDADTETSARRAYFTDFDREQVISHYFGQFSVVFLKNIPMLTLRLNYPPEDAFTLVRDQTRSTFLEEIVHPFRESVYVNGFKPVLAKDDIWYRGVHYEQKITVRYVSSSVLVRVTIAVFSMILFWVVLREFLFSAFSFFKIWVLKK